MKKILYSIFAFAAVAGLSSCKQDAVDDSNLAGDENTLTIIGTRTVKVALVTDADDTRASLGKDEATGRYTFNWENGDQLGGYEIVYANSIYTSYTDPYVTLDKVTVDENGNAFAEINYKEIEGANQYFFALFYPQSAVKGKTLNFNGGTDSTLPITVPEVQHPTDNAPDPNATVLCAYVPGAYGDNDPLETAEISFKHLTAYGKMTLKNLEKGKTVKSVKFDFLTTEFCVAGRFDSYKFIDEYNSHNACQGKSYGNTNCSSVTLDYSNNPLTVNDDGTATVWFGLVSNDFLANTGVKTFKVEVTYSDEPKPVSKTFTSDSQTLTFKNSKVTSFSVDMTPPAVEGTYIYVPVQSVTPGKDYVIAMEYNGTTYILSSTTDGGQYTGIASTSKVKVTALNIAGFTKVGSQLEYEVITNEPTEYTYCTLPAGDNYFNFYSKKKGQSCILWGITSGYLTLYDGGDKTNTNGKFQVSTNDTGTTMSFYAFSSNYYVYTNGTTASINYQSPKNVTIYEHDPNGQPAAPVQEVKLNIADGSANQQHPDSPIKNLWDGIVNTNTDSQIYHSPWPEDQWGDGKQGTQFPIELTFNLERNSDVYRMYYYTRTDENANGHPGRVDVHYRSGDSDTWHPAVANNGTSMYDFNNKRGSKEKNGGYYHEMDFSNLPLKNAKSIKVTVYSGNADFVTAAEVEFFGTSDSGGSVPENPDVKLNIKGGTANQVHSGNGGLNKLWDGDTINDGDNYIYHTPWGSESWGSGKTGTEFPVVLTFNIDKSNVNYFNYYTRKEANANGLPGKFDVRYRCEGETNGTYHNLNSNYNENDDLQTRITNAQFDMGKTPGAPFVQKFSDTLENVVEVQIVFYEGSCNDNGNGYISGVEIEFWGKPAN